MKAWFPPTWKSLYVAGTSWKYCFHSSGKSVSGHCSQVRRLGSRVAPSAGPHLRQSVFLCSRPVFLKNTNSRKATTYSMPIIGSRDTSQGRWEGPVAVIWLPAFVARLVRQV